MDKAGLKKLLDDRFDNIIAYLNAQPKDTFATRVVADKWSNGEHLEHLRKTTRGVNKGMAVNKLLLRFKFGVKKGKEKSFKELQDTFKDLGAKQAFVSPKQLVPEKVENKDKERIIKWFLEEKQTMKAQVDKLTDQQLSKYVLPHPYAGNLSFREFVCFTALHTDHHWKLMQRDNQF